MQPASLSFTSYFHPFFGLLRSIRSLTAAVWHHPYSRPSFEWFFFLLRNLKIVIGLCAIRRSTDTHSIHHMSYLSSSSHPFHIQISQTHTQNECQYHFLKPNYLYSLRRIQMAYSRNCKSNALPLWMRSPPKSGASVNARRPMHAAKRPPPTTPPLPAPMPVQRLSKSCR